MSTLDFPYRISLRGRTAATTHGEHLRDLIEQVLLTGPGERVNRPDFGCGLLQSVFAPFGEETMAATQFLVQTALQQWLGDLIEVSSVETDFYGSTLRIRVSFIDRKTQEAMTADIEQGGAS